MKHDYSKMSRIISDQGLRTLDQYKYLLPLQLMMKEYAEHMANSNPWRALPVPDDVDGDLLLEVSCGSDHKPSVLTALDIERAGFGNGQHRVWRYLENEAYPTPEEVAAIYAEAE